MAEERMEKLHKLHSRSIRNKYLKDLFSQWRGAVVAYDEGLARGDDVLAAAVWRNVCKADEDVDIIKLRMVVSYMRSVVHNLNKMGNDAISAADIVFGDPQSEAELVRERSAIVDREVEMQRLKQPSKILPA